MAQITNGQRTDYVQDVTSPLPQVLTARNGSATTRYLRGLGLIGEQQAGGSFQYHLPDALGSVRQITDPTGQVLQTRRYDPFGGLQTSTGFAQTAYGFAGEEQDPTTGQVYLRARTYNPETGRFLQQDPVMGTPNQPRTLHNYAYSFNNPVNFVDPSGQQPPTQRSANTAPVVSTQPGALADVPANNYSPAAPTQPGGNNAQTPRSANAPPSANSRGKEHPTTSDAQAQAQSQGLRPESCGPTHTGGFNMLDVLWDINETGNDVLDAAQKIVDILSAR